LVSGWWVFAIAAANRLLPVGANPLQS